MSHRESLIRSHFCSFHQQALRTLSLESLGRPFSCGSSGSLSESAPPPVCKRSILAQLHVTVTCQSPGRGIIRTCTEKMASVLTRRSWGGAARTRVFLLSRCSSMDTKSVVTTPKDENKSVEEVKPTDLVSSSRHCSVVLRVVHKRGGLCQATKSIYTPGYLFRHLSAP